MSRMLSLVFNHYLEAVLAAALLVSPAAYAGPSRGLSLASAEAPPPHANKSADPGTEALQPAALRGADPQSSAPAVTQPVSEAKASKHHKTSFQARMIHELHRFGIYW